MHSSLEQYRKQISEARQFIQSQLKETSHVGIILGSGLGGLAKEMEIIQEFPYVDIPHFAESTVVSHEGKLLLGKLGKTNVLAMQGRLHLYEGYSMQEITFPVRVLYELGVRTLLISNAAGGMNPQFRAGDIMVIEDHINLMPGNPLIGPNMDEYGPRFPDMSEPYSQKLIALAEEIALENKIDLKKGVYVAVTGPNLETRAEYRFLRTIGADVVGMSTVPENLVAVQMGMQVLAFSVITDECFPDALKPANVTEILETAAKSEPKLTTILSQVIKRI